MPTAQEKRDVKAALSPVPVDMDLPSPEEVEAMSGLNRRRIAFSIYSNTVSIDSVVASLHGLVTHKEVENWAEIEQWDDHIKFIAQKYIEPLQKLAAGWMVGRFLLLNKGVERFVHRMKDATDGVDANFWANAVAKLHDKQMIMLDRPSDISRSEVDNNSSSDRPLEEVHQLEKKLAILERAEEMVKETGE